MDENFTPNTNNIPENDNAVENEPINPVFTPQSTPASESQVNNQPQGFNYNTNAESSNNYYQQQPPFTNPGYQPNNPPYGNQQYPYTPYPQMNGAHDTKKKKQKNPGKIVFIVLVCLAIVCASIAVGLRSDEKNTDNNKTTLQNPQNAEDAVQNNSGDGAEPILEDSPASYSEYSGKGTMTPEQIYKEVKDINVGILVYSQKDKAGEGSGIIVGPDKTNKYTYILTAAHVIADSGVSIQVQFANGTEVDAQIVGIDSKTDVGVVRVEGTDYKAATFGNSDKLSVGQTVYAIGNPGGTEFFGSFTSGMISAIDRPVPTTNSSYDLPCIQHNAAINPGNSGGALVNEYGQVIGLNSSKISSTEYEGMGFSVPVKTVLEVYNQIIAHGYVTNRPMLGIQYFPVSTDYTYSSLAWKNDLPYGSIVIAAIDQNSDMAKQNVEIGDVITAVNGKKLENTDMLLETIEKSSVGDKLTLDICRFNNNGSIHNTFKITVTLVEDKGTSVVTEPEVETNPFSSYFEGFGY